MPTAVIILLIVFIAVALRQFVNRRVPIWMIMLMGATATIVLGQISPLRALSAIEPEVIFYLLGVFLIAQAAEESGYLGQVTEIIFSHATNGAHALFIIIFVLGLSAALLMNDTVAIIGTPIILQLCKSQKDLLKPLLLALAFAVTIGSTMSPIGNPQNLLVAVKGGFTAPFFDFIRLLAVPALLNLGVVYLFLYIIYRQRLNKTINKPILTLVNHRQTAILVKLSLALLLFLISIKIITDLLHLPLRINFSYIALISAVPVCLSPQRWIFFKRLDWGTLLFFVSTFILMQSVWDSGFFQTSMRHFHLAVTHIPVILTLSLVLSQFISNVPLVALYLSLLAQHSAAEPQYIALAVGSTLAGNLSILGAASNVIILQGAEKRKKTGFSFFEFVTIGLPLTVINVLIYAYFL